MARIGPGPEWQVSEQKLREPTFKIIQSQTADFANFADVHRSPVTPRKRTFGLVIPSGRNGPGEVSLV
jgi:hypothetical protein